MYLLTAIKLSPDTRKWLNSYAIKLSRDTWLHNSTCPGTEAVQMSQRAARQMQRCILLYAIPWIDRVHSMVMEDRFNRKDLHLIKNKLELLHEAVECGDIMLQIASYMDIFSEIVEEHSENITQQEPNENATLLGIEEDSVQNFLLSLVKKETMH